MDSLSDDLLINIATRVAIHSMHDLFYFQRTNKRHVEICRDVEVSRAFGNDVITLLTDMTMTHEKLDLMNRLWDHGNHMFCILKCSQQLLHAKPNFGVINSLLANVVAAHSLSAKYFQVLVNATGYPLENEALLLNDFRWLIDVFGIDQHWWRSFTLLWFLVCHGYFAFNHFGTLNILM